MQDLSFAITEDYLFMATKKKLRAINYRNVVVSDINHLDEIAEESYDESNSDSSKSESNESKK